MCEARIGRVASNSSTHTMEIHYSQFRLQNGHQYVCLEKFSMQPNVASPDGRDVTSGAEACAGVACVILRRKEELAAVSVGSALI